MRTRVCITSSMFCPVLADVSMCTAPNDCTKSEVTGTIETGATKVEHRRTGRKGFGEAETGENSRMLNRWPYLGDALGLVALDLAVGLQIGLIADLRRR